MIKGMLKKIVLSILIFIILFNFGLTSITFAAPEGNSDSEADTLTDVQEAEERHNLLLDGIMEGIAGILFIIPRLLLLTVAGVVNVGTYAIASSGMAEGTVTSTFITPFDIIFNQFALTDINVFSLDDLNSNGFIYQVRTNVSMWFTIIFVFSMIVLIIVLFMLLCMMVLRKDIAEEKAKVGEAFKNWFISIILCGLSSSIAYVVVYFNGVVVKMLKGIVAVDLSTSMLALQEAAFSTTSHILGNGATIVYVLLSFQTLIFLCKYIFRFLKVSLLVIISPLVPVPYSICKMLDTGSDTAIRNWLIELIFTVCDQIIHCLVYSFVVGVALEAFAGATEISGIEALAPAVVAIIAIFFVGPAERLIRNLFRIRKAVGIVQVASDFVRGSAQALVYVQGMANVIRGDNPDTAFNFGEDMSKKEHKDDEDSSSGQGSKITYKGGNQDEMHVEHTHEVISEGHEEDGDSAEEVVPAFDNPQLRESVERFTEVLERLSVNTEHAERAVPVVPEYPIATEVPIDNRNEQNQAGGINEQPFVTDVMSKEQYNSLINELRKELQVAAQNLVLVHGKGNPETEGDVQEQMEKLARMIEEKISSCKTEKDLTSTIDALENSMGTDTVYKDFVTRCAEIAWADNFIKVEDSEAEVDTDKTAIKTAVEDKAKGITDQVNAELVAAIIKALDSSPEFKEVARQIASKAVAFSAEVDGEVELNTQRIAEYITRMSASSEHEGTDNAAEAMEELKKQVSEEGAKKIDEFNAAISEGDIKKAQEIRKQMDDATKALVEMEAIAESYGFTARMVDNGTVTETSGIKTETIGVTRTPNSTQNVINDLMARKSSDSPQE